MQESPFQILGLKAGCDEEEVRAAYHAKVKLCHPDRFQDPKQKAEAQEKLTRLNLAYEEALKVALPHRNTAYSATLPLEDALELARKMISRNAPKAALRELMRAESRNAVWYSLYGEVLMAMEDFGGAHSAYREAIKMEPDNIIFRRGALDAVVAQRNSQTIAGKLKKIFRRKK